MIARTHLVGEVSGHGLNLTKVSIAHPTIIILEIVGKIANMHHEIVRIGGHFILEWHQRFGVNVAQISENEKIGRPIVSRWEGFEVEYVRPSIIGSYLILY